MDGTWSSGTGPGAHSPDGWSVEVTLRREAGAVPELLAAQIPPGSTVLELGAGTGRLSSALASMGYEVTALDHSPDMLAHVEGCETVLADMRMADLGRTFDAVVLATFLVNVPDDHMRRDFLRACRRHIATHGQVFIERQRPEVFSQVKPLRRESDDGSSWEVVSAEWTGELLTVHEVYRHGDCAWNHTFTARHLDDEQTAAELASAGLRLDGWLNPTWLVARGQ